MKVPVQKRGRVASKNYVLINASLPIKFNPENIIRIRNVPFFVGRYEMSYISKSLVTKLVQESVREGYEMVRKKNASKSLARK